MPWKRLDLLRSLGERSRHADVRQWWAQVGDEGADLVEAAPQHVAQERELRLGGAVGVPEHAVQVLDLEDGVGEDLGRPVVDVLGHALTLALLGLDDPQAHVGGRVVADRARLVAGIIGRVEVAPQDVQLAGHHVQALEAPLERGQVPAAGLVLGTQRVGPDRSKRATTAIDASTKLHPLLEVAPILLAEAAPPARACGASLPGGSLTLRRRCGRTARLRSPARDRSAWTPLSTGSGLVPDLASMLSACCALQQQYFVRRKYYRLTS